MANQLLYITGAGASVQRVPLVASLRTTLPQFVFCLDWLVKILESGRSTRTRDLEGPLADEQNLAAELLQKASGLSRSENNHATLDTYAKKLHFQKSEPELHDLKVVFSIFLLFVQAQRLKYGNDLKFEDAILNEVANNSVPSDAPVDTRYDTSLASLMRLRPFRLDNIPIAVPAIPETVKLISWNYDVQLERAYFGFTGDQRLVGSHIRDLTQFYQINGTCLFDGLLDSGYQSILQRIFSTGDFGIYDCLRLYKLAKDKTIRPGIRFAWETETQKRLDILNPYSESTTAVVIGYSFPYFNREIDVEIFARLPDLEHLYIQVPDSAFPGINERLRAVLSLRRDKFNRGTTTISSVEHIKDTDTFYIPNDF